MKVSRLAKAIAVVVPTCMRDDSMLVRAINSVRAQHRHPDSIIVVGDNPDITCYSKSDVQALVESIPCHYLCNTRQPGYAGAVNSGLSHLKKHGFSGFVALLDDDDSWDDRHLESNLHYATESGSNVVVSGLRMICRGSNIPRPLPNHLVSEDFLAGNPGWQGSNTFVEFELLLKVGGFREGLLSCNDRDLAIRLLDHPETSVAYTGEWTANWNFNRNSNQLSAWRSPSKLAGFSAFYKIYQHRMDGTTRCKFFERAKDLFGLSEDEITGFAIPYSEICLMNEKVEART